VAYLPKPFSPAQLAAKVRDVLLEPAPENGSEKGSDG
jgi:DNA-binding response OmpR family regulator